MIAVDAFHYDLMGDLARRLEIRSFLEIGVSSGGSFLATVRSSLGTLRHVIACDTWGPTHGGKNKGSSHHIEKALDDLGYGWERTFLDGPSAQVIPQYVQQRPGLVDLVHIDADHTEHGALSDMRIAWPLVGRAMVVHDVFMPAVWAALSQFSGEKLAELASFEVSAHGTGTAVLGRRA